MNKIRLIIVCAALLTLSACGQKNTETENNNIKAYDAQEKWSDKPIQVINLWASWCQPCRQELPVLSAFSKKHPEISVIGIALDNRQNVEKFLQTTSTTYPIRYYDEDATEVFSRFGNNTGGIPYTVIDASKCGFRQPYFGVISAEQLENSIAKAKEQCRYRH